MKIKIALSALILTATAATAQTPNPKTVTILDVQSDLPNLRQLNLPVIQKRGKAFLNGQPNFDLITPSDIEKYQVFTVRDTNRAFEPGAFDLLLKTPGKLLIITECYQKAESVRKFGSDQAALTKANPIPKGHTPFTYEESKGTGNNCNIIRFWAVEEKKDSKKLQEAHQAIARTIQTIVK